MGGVGALPKNFSIKIVYLSTSTLQGEGIIMQKIEDDDPNEPVPGMQQLLDNPFMLLLIGVLFPTVFYLLWGIMEIISIPAVK